MLIVAFYDLYIGIIQPEFTLYGVGVFLSLAVLFVMLAEVINPGDCAGDSLHDLIGLLLLVSSGVLL